MESASSSVAKHTQISTASGPGQARNPLDRPPRRGELIAGLADEIRSLGGSDPVLASVELPAVLVDEIIRRGLPRLRTAAAVGWERPASETSLFGFGAAATLAGGRSSTIMDAAICLREATQKVRYSGGAAARPRFFGGARFYPSGTVRDPAWDAFGGWRFILPEVIIAVEHGRASGAVTLALSPSDTACDIGGSLHRVLAAPFEQQLPAVRPSFRAVPEVDPEAWQAAVGTALAEIGAGRYRKVVLARRVSQQRTAAASAGELLTRLVGRYPACFVFKFAAPHGDWIGASPELLGSAHGGVVRAASLAGTRRRSDDPRIDERLSAGLLDDPKERCEHAFVAAAMREALVPLCTELAAPAEPAVMSIANIHHLHTPFEGQLRDGTGILDVVAALHPTPAVGGSPRTAALDAIDRLEGIDRGWYAGPIGWTDLAGDGEFAVGLRSGLVGDATALLFAGAGIVEGSLPGREFSETELKLQPLREALIGD
ncbi:MAG TPA: isochorismate synthase [Tepidiformaceae bacterium]|nr:isochorismate synthase [Tepidiformaceae bacterium]